MNKLPRRNAFSLVEVTVALGVASFCLLIIVGLLPAGVSLNRNSLAQTTAANLSTSIVSDLQATPTTNSTSSVYSLPMTGDTTIYLREDGTVAPNAQQANYRARVVTAAGTGGTHTATTVRIYITWPALANPATGAPGAFDTVIALNRN